MRLALPALILCLTAPPTLAHEDPDDAILASSTDLREWCRRESEARLVGESRTPSNWTARHYEKLNTLIVEGRWRVDGEEIEVECRAARGARAEAASLTLSGR